MRSGRADRLFPWRRYHKSGSPLHSAWKAVQTSLISHRKEMGTAFGRLERDDVDSLGNMDTNEIKSAILKYKKRLRSVQIFSMIYHPPPIPFPVPTASVPTTLDAWKEGLSTARLQVAERSSSSPEPKARARDAAKILPFPRKYFRPLSAGSRIQDIAIA